MPYFGKRAELMRDAFMKGMKQHGWEDLVVAEKEAADDELQGPTGFRAPVENAGAVYDEPESAGWDVSLEANKRSIAENQEYHWLYYCDNKTGKIGHTDPYPFGKYGSKIDLTKYATVNGEVLNPDSITLFGSGHTHGAYEHPSDVSFSDYDKNGDRRGDIPFMLKGAPKSWSFFTLGTPAFPGPGNKPQFQIWRRTGKTGEIAKFDLDEDQYPKSWY